MTCSSCGALIPEGTKFCGICGVAQIAPAPVEPVPAEPAPPPVYQDPTPPVVQEPPVYAAPPAPVYQAQPTYQQPAYQQPAYPPQPAYQAPPEAAGEQPPPKGSRYAPISAIGYIGYFILFAIPIIGQILCIAFAFGKSGNANRRSLARAMFVMLILALVMALTVGIAGAVTYKQIQNGTIEQNGIFSWIPGLASGSGENGGAQFPFGGDGGGSGDGGDGGAQFPFGGEGYTPEGLEQAFGQMFSATWPDNEFTRQVPKPKFEVGLGAADESSFGILTSAGVDQLKDYVKELKKAGFTISENTEDQSVFGMQMYSYSAYNGKGYGVEVNYIMGMSTISIRRANLS